MKFEIHVIQIGVARWGKPIGAFTETCSTVMAIFQVEGDTVEDALLKMTESEEFQNIGQIENLMISVVGEIPTYYLGKR